MLPVLLLLLSILFACVVPVMAILFVVRWIVHKKKWPLIIVACVCAVLSAVSFFSIGFANYYSMSPEEREEFDASMAAHESRIEESRREEESRQAEIANCTHDWGSGEITIQATCEKDGVRTYTCSKCETTKTETIKATGHTYVEVEKTVDLDDRKATIKSNCPCGKTKTDKKDMSVSDMETYLKENCKTYDYKEIARYPDKHNGELTTFTGEVLQVYQEDNETVLLVQITKVENEYITYYTDSLYVTYEFTDGLKILEEDIIIMYGKSTGEYTYTSIFGQSITVPSFTAYYAELVE